MKYSNLKGTAILVTAALIWGFAFAYILNYPYKWMLDILEKIPKSYKEC